MPATFHLAARGRVAELKRKLQSLQLDPLALIEIAVIDEEEVATVIWVGEASVAQLEPVVSAVEKVLNALRIVRVLVLERGEQPVQIPVLSSPRPPRTSRVTESSATLHWDLVQVVGTLAEPWGHSFIYSLEGAPGLPVHSNLEYMNVPLVPPKDGFIIHAQGPDLKSCTVNDLQRGMNYFFRVRVVSHDTNSVSACAVVQTQFRPLVPPTGLELYLEEVRLSEGVVLPRPHLKWKAAAVDEEAHDYVVERRYKLSSGRRGSVEFSPSPSRRNSVSSQASEDNNHSIYDSPSRRNSLEVQGWSRWEKVLVTPLLTCVIPMDEEFLHTLQIRIRTAVRAGRSPPSKVLTVDRSTHPKLFAFLTRRALAHREQAQRKEQEVAEAEAIMNRSSRPSVRSTGVVGSSGGNNTKGAGRRQKRDGTRKRRNKHAPANDPNYNPWMPLSDGESASVSVSHHSRTRKGKGKGKGKGNGRGKGAGNKGKTTKNGRGRDAPTGHGAGRARRTGREQSVSFAGADGNSVGPATSPIRSTRNELQQMQPGMSSAERAAAIRRAYSEEEGQQPERSQQQRPEVDIPSQVFSQSALSTNGVLEGQLGQPSKGRRRKKRATGAPTFESRGFYTRYVANSVQGRRVAEAFGVEDPRSAVALQCSAERANTNPELLQEADRVREELDFPVNVGLVMASLDYLGAEAVFEYEALKQQQQRTAEKRGRSSPDNMSALLDPMSLQAASMYMDDSAEGEDGEGDREDIENEGVGASGPPSGPGDEESVGASTIASDIEPRPAAHVSQLRSLRPGAGRGGGSTSAMLRPVQRARAAPLGAEHLVQGLYTGIFVPPIPRHEQSESFQRQQRMRMEEQLGIGGFSDGGNRFGGAMSLPPAPTM